MITVQGQDKKTGATSIGTLTMCDLAGSERVSKTEATGQRLVEAANINKSLSSLGQVMLHDILSISWNSQSNKSELIRKSVKNSDQADY